MSGAGRFSGPSIVRLSGRLILAYSIGHHPPVVVSRTVWLPAKRVSSADLENGTARPELGMLRAGKDTCWRFAEYRIPLASIHPTPHVKNYRTEARILDEFGPHTLLKRTLKSGRLKKERKSSGDPRGKPFEVYRTKL